MADNEPRRVPDHGADAHETMADNEPRRVPDHGADASGQQHMQEDTAPTTLEVFLASVGPEFGGMAQTVADAFGSDDLEEILSFVQSRDDCSELDDAGIDAASVDKLFARIQATQQ